MHARICELENGSVEIQQRQAAGTERQEVPSVGKREAANGREEQGLKNNGAPVQYTDGTTAATEAVGQDRAVSTVQ